MILKSERLAKLLEFIKEEPNDLFLQYALAMEYTSLKKLNTAKEILMRIIEVDADYTAAYYQLAQLLIEEGSEESALKYLSIGINTAKDLKTKNEFRALLDELNL